VLITTDVQHRSDNDALASKVQLADKLHRKERGETAMRIVVISTKRKKYSTKGENDFQAN